MKLSTGNLKTNHEYYGQVQINMFVTNHQVADLFIFSKKSYKLVTIQRNEEYL